MPINVNVHNPIVEMVLSTIQHYNHKKYWRRRAVCTSKRGHSLIYKVLCLLYIKRCDAFHNVSTGTDFGGGATFKTPPRLPHGLNGIIISPYAQIGANVSIFQQVTIGDDGKFYKNAPIIGNNVVIGAGAKILGKVTIGDNAKIGAGAIVVEDVPSGATAVGPKAKIILNKNQNG